MLKAVPKRTIPKSILLKSWFDNLFENKFILSQNENLHLVQLKSLSITDSFSAKISQISNISNSNSTFEDSIYFSLRLWKTQIKYIDEKHRSFSIRKPNPLTFWIEPYFVMYIEKLVTYGDFNEAIELIEKYGRN